MNNWKEYKLGELVLSASKTFKFSNKQVIFLNTSDTLEGRVVNHNLFNPEELPGQAKKSIQKDDILYSEIRPENRRYAYIDFDATNYVVSTKLMVLRAIDKGLIAPKYLYYFLTSNDVVGYLQMLAESRSGTFPQIRFEEISLLDIKLPPLEIQHQVIDVISSLDDKIELNNRINAELESLAQALFKQWFIDFEFPDANGRIDGLPIGWRKDVFRNHLLVERGLSYKGDGLTTGEEGIPMNNLNSVYEGGGYKYEGIKYYKGDYKEKHIAKPNDIIVTNTEQGHKYLLIGFPAVVPSFYGETTIYSHHIYRVRTLTESYLTPQFIYYLLLQPHIREQVVGFSNGTTVNMLKIDGLQLPEFVLPDKTTIEKFTDLIVPIWKEKETNYQETQSLTQLRDTLLPRLLSGELAVEGLN